MPTPPPWWQSALLCRCPRCGKGALYDGVLAIHPACTVCSLDLRGHDTGDGAAAIVILFLGFIVVGLAFWVEFRFMPPLWLHALLWPVVTLALALPMIRTFKAALVAMQFRHRASEMGL
jgi:uncharacterized protein (DUF983 family)